MFRKKHTQKDEEEKASQEKSASSVKDQNKKEDISLKTPLNDYYGGKTENSKELQEQSNAENNALSFAQNVELERSDVENITNYIAFLQDKVPHHLIKAVRNEEELRSLKEKHMSMEREVKDLRERSEEMKQRSTSLMQDKAASETRLENERKENERIAEELNVSRSALSELERDYRDLKNQYDIAVDKKSYLEKLFEEKAEKLSALQVSYSEISARRNLLEIDIIEKINDLKGAQSLVSDLRRETDQRRNDTAKKDEKMVTLSTEILNLKRIIADKNDTVHKHEQDYKALFDEFHKMKSDHDVSIRNLTSKLTALEQKNAFISRRYEEMRDEYKGLKGGYASIVEENKYLKAKYLGSLSDEVKNTKDAHDESPEEDTQLGLLEENEEPTNETIQNEPQEKRDQDASYRVSQDEHTSQDEGAISQENEDGAEEIAMKFAPEEKLSSYN